MKRIFTVFTKYLYISTMLIFSAGAGIFLTTLLIGILKHPVSSRQDSVLADNLEQILSQTSEQVVRRLGEWEFSEPKIPGHFHHIGKWYDSDNWNFCIACHGSVPHSKSKEIRSFLNMHTMFISCQVCHVRMDKPDDTPEKLKFGWIDLKEGKLQPNPPMKEGTWGEYGVKIIQLTGNKSTPEPLFMSEERNVHKEIKARKDDLTETQKGISNKILHKRCIEKPVKCSHCHTTNSPLIHYRSLGYSQERQEYLVNAEVVEMVERYETFFMPTLLNPEESELDTLNMLE